MLGRTARRLRSLAPKENEPVPVAVTASQTADRLYLLEESKDVQRVRGLSWKENTKEGETRLFPPGATFFENSIHPVEFHASRPVPTTPR